MIKRIFLLLCLFPISTHAQDIDYLNERLLLAEDSNYEPYVLYASQIALLQEHYKLGGDPATSISEINRPLQELSELYPLSIQVNFAIAGFLEFVASHSEDQVQASSLLDLAENKRDKGEAILESILASGDGNSMVTAYQVINLSEEDAVLDYLDETKIGQAVLENDGKYFDLLTTRDLSGRENSIYFDISLFYK